MTERVTAARLIDVAIELFGRDGFEAVTTRAIADAAGAQQSAISYHFGSKDRLYLACAEHIAETMKGRLAPVLDHLGQDRAPADAHETVEALLSGLLAVMLDEAIAPVARFVVREQMNPTPAFTIMWDGAIRPLAELLTERLSVIAGRDADPQQLYLRAFTLVGQVFVFRFGRASLARLTGWETIGSAEVDLARSAVLANARAILHDLAQGARK